VYVACFAGSPSQNDTVVVLDGRSDTVVTAVAVGRDPWALAWNSTNSRIYAANRGSGTISVIRDTMTAVFEPPQAGAPVVQRGVHVSPTPAHREVRFDAPVRSARTRLHVVNATGRVTALLAPVATTQYGQMYVWDCLDGCGRPAAVGVYTAMLLDANTDIGRVQFVVVGR
jgi:DNA-binding beta-propeller fold protein YncE